MPPELGPELEEIVARLDDEPLTHLMLGHRELFHSNLLAWFFNKLPEASDLVFGALTGFSSNTNTARAVRREQKNLDLWFQWPNRSPLVIENKVFSLPDEAQLNDYAVKATANGNTAFLWLLSLSDPNWPDGRIVIGRHEWRWLSYHALAESIRAALPKQDGSYAVETMRHYADVVDLLTKLVARAVVSDPSETVALPEHVRIVLAGNRLMSPMAKLRARSVAQYLSKSLCAAGVKEMKVGSGFTNGTSLNEWFSSVSCAPDAKAGWQLQGDQFRLALITPSLAGNAEKNISDRTEFGKKHENVFDFSNLDAHLGTAYLPVQPIKRTFGHYNPDFIYRYKKVPHLTLRQLEAAALEVARTISPS